MTDVLRSYKGGGGGIRTLKDEIIEYNDKKILVQTNEFDTSSIKGLKSVKVAELVGELYNISNEENLGITEIIKIDDSKDREELTEIIKELGIKGSISF